MKIAKALVSFVSIALTIYLGVFAMWLMFGMACFDYVDQHGLQDNECGQDVLSQVVRTTHAPLIALMIGSNKK